MNIGNYVVQNDFGNKKLTSRGKSLMNKETYVKQTEFNDQKKLTSSRGSLMNKVA